jgi:hypothetical protein
MQGILTTRCLAIVILNSSIDLTIQPLSLLRALRRIVAIFSRGSALEAQRAGTRAAANKIKQKKAKQNKRLAFTRATYDGCCEAGRRMEDRGGGGGVIFQTNT